MELVINILSWVFILAGSFFYLVGAAGLLRMPDVFSRMHAASVSDTMGASLLIIGMMLQAGISLVLAKLFMLWFFILFTGPVATHALARAARYAGVEPILDGAPELTAPAHGHGHAPVEKKPSQKRRPAAKKAAPRKTQAKKPAAKTTRARKTE
ncbi:MAG: monovalent cation/H(+) antiporter subunit G [Hyphomicrobiales bacterium]